MQHGPPRFLPRLKRGRKLGLFFILFRFIFILRWFLSNFFLSEMKAFLISSWPIWVPIFGEIGFLWFYATSLKDFSFSANEKRSNKVLSKRLKV